MSEEPDLKARIKDVVVEELMLDVTADSISDEMPFFGADGLGIDSVDALQLVVALEKHFDLKIEDAEMARPILENVQTIATAIEAKNQN